MPEPCRGREGSPSPRPPPAECVNCTNAEYSCPHLEPPLQRLVNENADFRTSDGETDSHTSNEARATMNEKEGRNAPRKEPNSKLHFSYTRCNSLIINGAGEGNRTLVSALGRPHSTIEPHPRGSPLFLYQNHPIRATVQFLRAPVFPCRFCRTCGGGEAAAFRSRRPGARGPSR